MQLNNKINAYINKYGKNLDNVREPNSKARWLKPKPYNTVKNKMLSVGEFKYISTRTLSWKYKKSAKHIHTGLIVKCVPQWTIYVYESGY